MSIFRGIYSATNLEDLTGLEITAHLGNGKEIHGKLQSLRLVNQLKGTFLFVLLLFCFNIFCKFSTHFKTLELIGDVMFCGGEIFLTWNVVNYSVSHRRVNRSQISSFISKKSKRKGKFKSASSGTRAQAVGIIRILPVINQCHSHEV